MDEPIVSIITPTFNQGRFIGNCIESAIAQTFPYWEMIIVDDGSTDETGDIVRMFRDERIKYYWQENLGVWKLGETYNKALGYSRGKYIAILEGDDCWPKHKLEAQIPSFEDNEVVLSWGKGISIASEGSGHFVTPQKPKRFQKLSRKEMLKKLIRKNVIQSSTVICKRQSLFSIGGFQQPINVPQVDYPTWLKLGLVGNYCFLNKVLGYWRQHEKQVSGTLVLEMAYGSAVCVENFYRELPQNMRKELGLNSKNMNKIIKNNIALGYHKLGRVNSIRGDWKKARQNFIDSFKRGTSTVKIVSLFGILCCLFHLDLEWVADMINKQKIIN